MKVLITGAAGFIGSHAMEEFAAAGHEVVGIDNFNDNYDVIQKLKNLEALNKQGLRVVRHDIREHSIFDAVKKESPDVIVHLAAVPGVRQSIEDPSRYVAVNTLGTQNILNAAKDVGAKVVFASSSSVYGKREAEPFKEHEVESKPISPYAASKHASELLCYTHHHLTGLPVACLRFFTVYGPRGRPDMAPYLFMDAIHNQNEMIRFGDGSSMRDYTYVKDIVQGILLAAEKADGFRVYNLGAGSPVLLSDFISLLEDVIGKKAIIKQQPPHPGDVRVTYADISKAKKELGYEPKFSVEQGIKEQYAWYRSYLSELGMLDDEVFDKF